MRENVPANGINRLAGAEHSTLQQQLKELTCLYETTKILRSTLDLDALLEVVVTTIVRIFEPSDAGVVFLYDEDRHKLVPRSAFGHRHESLFQVELEVGEGLPGQAFRSAQIVACNSREEIAEALQRVSEENRRHFERALAWDWDCCCAICVPLLSRRGVIGSVLLQSARHEREPYSPSDMQVAQALADQIALAIENAQLWRELQRKEEIRGQLLAKIISAQEGERKRIARELHDEAGQALSTVIMSLGVIEEMLPPDTDGVKKKVKQARTFTIQALGEIRKLILDLRPTLLDDLGLIPALRWYIKNQLEGFHIDARLEASGFHGSRRKLPFQVETALFRIVQEALTNVAKYAEARMVRVRLALEDGTVTALIQDDGKGFDVNEVLKSKGVTQKLGLLGIEERVALLGGTFAIESQPGKGTSLLVQIPLTTLSAHDKTG